MRWGVIALVQLWVLLSGISVGDAWDFDKETDLRGWRATATVSSGGGNYRELRVEDGVLKVKIQEDLIVRLLSPELEAQAEWFDRVTFRIRVDQGIVPEGSVSMHWRTSESDQEAGFGPQPQERGYDYVSATFSGLTQEWKELNLMGFVWTGELIRFDLIFWLYGFDLDNANTILSTEIWIDNVVLTGPLYEALGRPDIVKEYVIPSPRLFSDYVLYDVLSKPASFFGGDFDGDGHPDLLLDGEEGKAISLLINNGDGNFSQRRQERDVQCTLIYSRDVDGDGDLDLVGMSSSEDKIFVLSNIGDGTFARPVGYSVGPDPAGVWGDDFDGDGDIDLAVSNFNWDVQWEEGVESPYDPESPGDYISILLNSGDGTFEDGGICEVGEHPSVICGGDFDSDGDKDLAVLVTGNLFAGELPSIIVLSNDGSSVFHLDRQVYPIEEYTGGGLSIHDWDEDGDVDCEVIRPIEGGSGSVVALVLLNDGDWSFSEGVKLSLGFSPPGFLRGDLDLDGDKDLVLVNGRDVNFSVFFNEGDRRYSDGGAYDINGAPSGAFLGDLDGDGDLDLAISSWSGNTVSILFNQTIAKVVGVDSQEDAGVLHPEMNALYWNIPNPFNTLTKIPFDLAFSGRVSITLYDVLGQKVRTLVEGLMSPGRYTILWDGQDDEGHPVASGRYLVRLQAGTFSDSKAMTLIK